MGSTGPQGVYEFLNHAKMCLVLREVKNCFNLVYIHNFADFFLGLVVLKLEQFFYPALSYFVTIWVELQGFFGGIRGILVNLYTVYGGGQRAVLGSQET